MRPADRPGPVFAAGPHRRLAALGAWVILAGAVAIAIGTYLMLGGLAAQDLPMMAWGVLAAPAGLGLCFAGDRIGT